MLLNCFTERSLKLKSLQSLHLVGINTEVRLLSRIQKRTWSKHPNIMDTQRPVLRISQGLIKGLERKTVYGHTYYSFEGIPYAEPPVGELRFKAPVPASSWLGVRDCSEFDEKPLQKNHEGKAIGSEDCLYLNVFVKKLNCHEQLPVMVWIYGGAFNTGSGIRTKYSPDYFMQENMILVTFNYRLSSLGFLSLADPACEVPGNAGLKDQIMALKWVKENISCFRGDKNNITVFGESAGGASVHYMTICKQAQGLFHKAICMSGVVTNPWAFIGPSTHWPYRLAREKRYKGPNVDELVLDYLRKIPAEELVLVDKLNLEAVGQGGFYAFVPSLEPYDSENAVISQPLEELIDKAWGNQIPMIIGGTSFEGLVRYSQIKRKNILEQYNRSPELYFTGELRKTLTEEKITALVQQLKELHFNNTSDVMGFMDYDSFTSFWLGIHHIIKGKQSVSAAPIYQYLFDFDSPTFNHHRSMFCGDDIKQGVAHADDLSYLFYAYYSWKLDKKSKEYLTIQRMIKMWTAFAKTSNPNCECTKDSPWISVQDSDAYNWLRISNELSFEPMDEKFREKLNFWTDLYKK